MSRILASAFFALLAPVAVAADWSQAQLITVSTGEYEFLPHQLVFKRGVVYRLRIDNRGKEMHEFTAPEFLRSVEIRDPSVLNADRTEIEIPAGAVKELYFEAPQAGNYALRCSDHDWAGMTGEITVE